VRHPRKRAGASSVPQVTADAAKVVWALDFQFDSTIDGKAVKIASMVDEHTRESLLNIVERSITAERLIVELDRVFTERGGPPRVLRLDNGPEMISTALQRFCGEKVGLSYIPPGTCRSSDHSSPCSRRIRPLNDSMNPLFHGETVRPPPTFRSRSLPTPIPARVVIGDFKDEHSRSPRRGDPRSWRATATDKAGSSPGPLADRLRANADKLRGYADTHDRTRITLDSDTEKDAG
jgi:transposase InsO family protein